MPAWTPDGKHLVYQSAGPAGRLEFRRVSISAGEIETLPITPGQVPALLTIPTIPDVDVRRDGRLLFTGTKGQVETFDPRDGKTRTLGTLPAAAAGWGVLRWSPDGHSIAYMVTPSTEDDPKGGLWADDFKNPPRQVFHGWVTAYGRGPGDELYLLEGKPDLNAVLWEVNWNGQHLARTPLSISLPYDLSYQRRYVLNEISVSPDGRHLAFQVEQVMEAHIGMIENVQ